MNINQLIEIVKKKIEHNIEIQEIIIEDKTLLHKKHNSHEDGKFHIKLKIKSLELSKLDRIKSTKKIYHILRTELEEKIHSIQILIN